MVRAERLVRRLKLSDYGHEEIQNKAFVEQHDEGLSLHVAVDAIVADKTAAYCTVPNFSLPMGACVVPIGGIKAWFFRRPMRQDRVFGRWHTEMIPPARTDDDIKATIMAGRATEEAKANGLLRMAQRKSGTLKAFTD